VNLNWAAVQPAPGQLTGAHDALKGLSAGPLQAEFTGRAFANLAAPGGGVPPELIGFWPP